MERMTDHHPLAPSKMAQTEACPASGHFQNEFPNRSSGSAERGTLQHHATHTGDYHGLTDEEVVEVNRCREWIKNLPPGGVSQHEKKAVLYGPDRQILTFGTLDFLHLYSHHGKLADWKFGRTPVEADSLQLLVYTVAMFQEYRQLKSIDAIIIQPKLEPMERVKTYRAEEYDVLYGRIEMIIERANRENPEFVPGEEQCRWCNALRGCEAYRKSALYKKPNVKILTFF